MKSVLGRMERFLEVLVEGLFGRGADSLPAGILRRLATEIEKQALVKGGKRWAPGDCRILLTREAMRLVLPIQSELEEELRAALSRYAAQAGLCFSAPLRFKFAAGDGPGVALLGVSATFAAPPPAEDGETAACGAGTGPTKVFRRAGEKTPPRAWLRVEEGPDAGREFQLLPGRTIVGRQDQCHIILTDPKVSRCHAAIVHDEHGRYGVVDLGSTNGTAVNGRMGARHSLRDGDRIRVGQTVMLFRRDKPR
ncbi:MAG: FhaA domain-containing protein [Bacteroidota bacterium]